MARTLKLSKQAQMGILGAIVAVAALLAVVNFLLLPAIAQRKEAQAGIQEIQAKLEDQRRIIKTRPEVQRRLDEVQQNIRRLAGHVPLPVLGNLLLGMDEHIRACARELDVQIVQVVNQDILELEGSPFRVYRVRVTAQAGFRTLVRLIQNLQESNPLLSVSGMTILPREATPETHEVQFTVAWLIWADPAKRPNFLLTVEPPDNSESAEAAEAAP